VCTVYLIVDRRSRSWLHAGLKEERAKRGDSNDDMYDTRKKVQSQGRRNYCPTEVLSGSWHGHQHITRTNP